MRRCVHVDEDQPSNRRLRIDFDGAQRVAWPAAQGRPAYAQANRNLAIAEVFHLLGYLGLHGKLVRYSAIAEELKCTEDAVRKALATHARCWTGALPRPWECWPPPRRKSPSPR